MCATLASPEALAASPTASRTRASVRGSTIVCCLTALLASQNLLLWCFLRFPHWSIMAAVAAVAGIGSFATARRVLWQRDFDIDLRLIASCFGISILLFILGGEGRFLYQTSDWQVRNAVLHDLVVYPWPFAYNGSGKTELLRAPLGLYLLPALVGKIGGLRSAELALLAQSAFMMTGIVSLGAGLFQRASKRLVALVVFLGFSGMDVVGAWLLGLRLDMHLEGWCGVQFSSTLTLAYWVPMHALAGWIGAVLYLLWRSERIPLFAFLAPLPLLALLSPLALLGIMPFAAVAGVSTISSRSLRIADVAVPFAMLLVSLPALLYLSSATGAVAPQVNTLSVQKWAVFECIEVLPYLIAIVASGQPSRFGQGTVAVTAGLLLLLPWGQVGSGPDIPMRASIAALAILSVLVSDVLLDSGKDVRSRMGRSVALTTFLIGTVTPLSETWRAIGRPRQALPTCSYFGVVPGGAPTYVAPLDRVRSRVAPWSPTLVHPNDPSSCKEVDLKTMELRYVGREAT